MIATGNMGVTREGEELPYFQPGMELHAKLTLLAEGCRGSLTKIAMERFKLREGVQPQTYGLGVKELWEIDPARHTKGRVIHTVGWPMSSRTYGGSWLYMFGENLVSVGFVVGLDYGDPYLSPFEEMQRYKTHPHNTVASWRADGGSPTGRARCREGGFQSIPRLTFPGGCFDRRHGGIPQRAQDQGQPHAMKSGMVAAESVYDGAAGRGGAARAHAYPQRLRASLGLG